MDNTKPYITDEQHLALVDRQKAFATHLREMARKLNKWADEGPILTIPIHEQIALNDAILAYTKANYGKIGDISFADGLRRLVKFGSHWYYPEVV